MLKVFLLCLAALVSPLIPAQLVINEVLASNAATNTDPDFDEAGDWAELLNVSSAPVDLSLYAISDDPTVPLKWSMPFPLEIPPGEHVLIWLDGQDSTRIAAHSNFRLDADGESLHLTRIAGSVTIDSISFSGLGPDEAYARIPNGSGTFAVTEQPTPAAPNVLLRRGPPPAFSVATGRYTSAQSVAIFAGTGAEIRYTTMGDIPSEESARYSAPLEITSSTSLRARAFYPTLDPSPVSTVSIFIIATSTLPIMDFVIPPADLFDEDTGIYDNYNRHGREWERRAHIAVIPPGNVDVRETDGGLRINGGSSRGRAKKSFRIYMRSEYGLSEWSLPQITRSPDPTVNQLVLRAANNDGFLSGFTQLDEATYLRDELLREWSIDLGHRNADGFFVALHLNGQYWGLYNVFERIEEDLLHDTFGPEEWDIMKMTWNIIDRFHFELMEGTVDAWTEFLTWTYSHSFAEEDNWAELQTRIDLENFLDHFVLNIWAQNDDWPQNNWLAGRPRDTPDAVWRWFQIDGEYGIGLQPRGFTRNSLEHAYDPNQYRDSNEGQGAAPLSRVFQNVLSNPEGARRFITEMEEALNFELHPRATRPRLASMGAAVSPEIPAEAHRWDSAQRDRTADELIAGWDEAFDRMDRFLLNRNTHVRQDVVEHFDLAGTETLTLTAAGDGSGEVLVNGRAVTPPWEGVFFAGSEVALTARPRIASDFVQWSSGSTAFTTPTVNYVAGTAPRSVEINFRESDIGNALIFR